MSGRRKLLLADDSPTIQKVISLTFGDEGLEVVTAPDGRRAWQLLEEEPAPDILLADAVMPGPDGYELCARVKGDSRLRHVPVVLLVGTFEPFNEAEARRVGADAVLTKPFQSIRDLVSKVGSLLGGESKHEARGPSEAEEGHRELAAEVQTRRPEPAAEAAPPAEREAPEASFADLVADDELIEATPAESYAGAGPGAQHTADSFNELDEPLAGEPVYEARGAAAPAFEAQTAPPFGHSPAATSTPFDDRTLDVPPTSSHEAGAGDGMTPSFYQSPGAADDALLDLDQDEPLAGAPAAKDEFVLDLGDDLLEPAAPAPAQAAGEGLVSFADLNEQAPDAPGAFAEAAHGEEAAQAETAAAPSMRFEPGGEGQARAGLAQEFIEPRVVPAAEPTPATFEGEFTDGSVEGDVPRPPAFLPDAPAPPAPFVPETPSTSGYAVGEARTGVEEHERKPAPREARPAELSPETIDAIARRVVELMSDKVVREIAWEVIPDLAELLIKQRLDEERNK